MKNFQSYSEFLNEAKLRIRPVYIENFKRNFVMYSKQEEIFGWILNNSSLEKDNELVWQKDGYSLYTNLYEKDKEEISFILVSVETGSTEFNLKRMVGSSTAPLKYTENYALDVMNYFKSLEKYIKKLNTVLV